MNVRVIANPIAGGGQGKAVAEDLCRALESQGLPHELVITRRAGDARSQAGKPGADYIVAVGGDGSVNEVANGLKGTEACLAILPLGTANVVARELQIRRDPERLARFIAEEKTRVIDVAVTDGRQFMLGAGAGFDGAIVARVHENRGKRLGFHSYVRPVFHVLKTYAFPPIRVKVDGETVCEDAHYAIVGNCRYSAGIFRFTPKARLDDGLLDVCLFRNLTMMRMARLALASWRPRFAERKDVFYTAGREVAFESADGAEVPLQIDGDPAGALPATFRAEPAALRVVAP